MISRTTQRSILRLIHLVLAIPILGYLYGPASEVQQHATAVRFVFVPVIILAGYWMFSGAVFAMIGVAAWLGAYLLSGIGAAILSQGRAIHRAKDLVGDSCDVQSDRAIHAMQPLEHAL